MYLLLQMSKKANRFIKLDKTQWRLCFFCTDIYTIARIENKKIKKRNLKRIKRRRSKTSLGSSSWSITCPTGSSAVAAHLHYIFIHHRTMVNKCLMIIRIRKKHKNAIMCIRCICGEQTITLLTSSSLLLFFEQCDENKNGRFF